MRSDMRKVWVHCYRKGTLIRSYDFGVPIPLDPRGMKLPTQEQLETDAKMNLTNEKVAFPPYDGITFRIEYES